MKRLASTTIECGSAEITITAEILPGSRATRDEPASGAEINRVLYAMRAEPCSPRFRSVCTNKRPKHTHDVALDLASLEAVLGPSAWAEAESALIESAADQDDEQDPMEDDR